MRTEAGSKHAAVDVIEFGGIHPLILRIVYLECAIRRDEFWLDWREIAANHASRGECKGELYGPDSSACGKIEDVLNAIFEGVDGRKVELVVESEKK